MLFLSFIQQTPVQQVLTEEALVDANVDTHMPVGMPFEATNYEDVDSCNCETEVPNCSTHGSFSPSKPRVRKRASSLLSQEVIDVKGDEDERELGPSTLELSREGARRLEGEIEEERKQVEALSSKGRENTSEGAGEVSLS